MKGSKNFSYAGNHAIWYFSSSKNRDLFVSDPDNYSPQYGGYCAYAVAHGDLVDIDPHSWKIVDGKLYLNFNKKTHKKWEKDILGYIEKADKNWPDILKKLF